MVIMNRDLPDYRKAVRHLSRRDATLKRLIREFGNCTLAPDPNFFSVLVRSIIAQQISTKAARSISNRLLEKLGPKGLEPSALMALDENALQVSGLSRAKRKALRSLAQSILEGIVEFEKLPDLPDEEVINHLLPVWGIGRWTGEMFLIFALGRMDVLPLADLGLRSGIRNHYGLEEHPSREEMETIAEPWKPYRSIATWYLWRTFGNVPQSE